MAGIVGRKGAEWSRIRKRVLEGATMCQMPDCKFPGVPLDFNASRLSPLYPTVDHIIPVSATRGWSEDERRSVLHDPRYLRPAHNACNASRGNRPVKRKTQRPSRDWGV